jgi:ParB-like chromosome segregation protein Spo0J
MFTFQTVSVQNIDLRDETFCISYGFSLDVLKRSIEKVGLIHPPLLQKASHGRYRVVGGWKRVLAVGELGYSQFIAALLPEGVREQDAFILNLCENVSHRTLNPIETALAINKLIRYISLQEIREEFLPLLGLGKSLSLLKTYTDILNLEEEIKIGLASGKITKEIVTILLQFSPQERIMLSQLITRLKLSKSKQVELVENCAVIRERDGVDVKIFLQSEEVKEILSDKKIGLITQGDRIREYVRKLRYPRLAQAEEAFRRKKEKLKLKGIALIPPPYFESEEFKVNFSFTTIEEFKKRLAQLQTLAEKEELKEIVEG